MWTQDLLYCLEVLHLVAPNCLVDRIDSNGIIYTTGFKKISLRKFLDALATEKEDYIKAVLQD